MRIFILVLLVFLFTNCKSQVSNNKKLSSDIKVENYGDTLRIETERLDKTTIKRSYVDLKGVSDDGFDSSFEVVSRYFEKKSTTIPQDGYSFSVAGFDFVLSKNAFLRRLDKKINQLKKSNSIPPEIESHQKLKKIVVEKRSFDGLDRYEAEFFTAQLLTYGTLRIDAKNEQVQPYSLLIESYITPFSGGRNFHIKTSERDTIPIFSFEDWMK